MAEFGSFVDGYQVPSLWCHGYEESFTQESYQFQVLPWNQPPYFERFRNFLSQPQSHPYQQALQPQPYQPHFTSREAHYLQLQHQQQGYYYQNPNLLFQMNRSDSSSQGLGPHRHLYGWGGASTTEQHDATAAALVVGACQKGVSSSSMEIEEGEVSENGGSEDEDYSPGSLVIDHIEQGEKNTC